MASSIPVCVAKMELIELVKSYKAREYDEEIVGVEHHGGKFGKSGRSSDSKPGLAVSRCRRNQSQA